MNISKYVLLFFILTLFGCAATSNGKNWTKQNLKKSESLRYGMNENQVLKVMGKPVKRDFIGNREIWNYCKTGFNGSPDAFVLLMFQNKKLLGVRNYHVTLREAGATGDCSKFTRTDIKI